MNKNLTLISNNPSLLNDMLFPAQIVAESNIDVINQCRDHIHAGAKLVTHPLAGSIKPWETPYRSILIQLKPENIGETSLDIHSLEMIESAIQKYNTKLVGINKPKPTLKSDADFQLVDKELMLSALKSLR